MITTTCPREIVAWLPKVKFLPWNVKDFQLECKTDEPERLKFHCFSDVWLRATAERFSREKRQKKEDCKCVLVVICTNVQGLNCQLKHHPFSRPAPVLCGLYQGCFLFFQPPSWSLQPLCWFVRLHFSAWVRNGCYALYPIAILHWFVRHCWKLWLLWGWHGLPDWREFLWYGAETCFSRLALPWVWGNPHWKIRT